MALALMFGTFASLMPIAVWTFKPVDSVILR